MYKSSSLTNTTYEAQLRFKELRVVKKLLGSNYKVSKVQISAKQFFILSILFAVGDAIIYIPSLMAQEGLHTMWIAGLLGIVQAFIIAFIYTVIGKRILNNGYIYTLKRLFGSWIGQLLTVLFLLYVMVDIVLMIYEMGSFIVTMVMPTTPIESVLIAFLVVVIIGARLGLETLARSAEILFPWFCFFYLLLVILNIPNINLENLQPLFEGSIYSIIKMNLPLASYLLETVILITLFPHINGQNKARSAYVMGVAVGVTLTVIISLLSLLVLGLHIIKISSFASYMLGKSVIANFFSHVEVTIAIIWFISVYFKITLCFLILAKGISKLFKTEDYRFITLPLGYLLYALAFISLPSNMYLSDFITSTWISYTLTFGLVFPLFIFGIGTLRKQNLHLKQ